MRRSHIHEDPIVSTTLLGDGERIDDHEDQQGRIYSVLRVGPVVRVVDDELISGGSFHEEKIRRGKRRRAAPWL